MSMACLKIGANLPVTPWSAFWDGQTTLSFLSTFEKLVVGSPQASSLFILPSLILRPFIRSTWDVPNTVNMIKPHPTSSLRFASFDIK